MRLRRRTCARCVGPAQRSSARAARQKDTAIRSRAPQGHKPKGGPEGPPLRPSWAAGGARDRILLRHNRAMNIRVMLVGLGPIGAAVARQVIDRKGYQLVGA